MVWGPLIAWYLFLAGAAAGAYLTASFVGRRHSQATLMRRAGRIMAPILLGIGLLMLMIDAEAGLHHPLRFLGLFANPGSVMTLGVYIICVFLPVSLIAAIMELAKKRVPAWLDAIGIVTAFGLAAYTGFLLGVSKGFPLWNNAALPILFVLSALSSGLALTSLFGLFGDRARYGQMLDLKKVHLVLVAMELAVLAIMLVIVSSAGIAGAASVAMIVSGSLAPAFWIGIVGFGLVIPLCIEVATVLCRKHPSSEGAAVALDFVGQAGVVVGGFLLRYVVITAAVIVVLL